MVYIPANELSMNKQMHIIIYIFISQYVCILAPHISQITRTNSQSSFGAAKSSPRKAWWIFLPLALAFALAPEAGQIRPVELSGENHSFTEDWLQWSGMKFLKGLVTYQTATKICFFKRDFRGPRSQDLSEAAMSFPVGLVGPLKKRNTSVNLLKGVC